MEKRTIHTSKEFESSLVVSPLPQVTFGLYIYTYTLNYV